MIFFTTSLRRLATTSAVAISVVLGTAMTANAQTVTLNGAGATFPQPLYQRYAAEFTKANPNTRINYQGIGSSGGIRQFIAGTVDFGGTDSPMTAAQIAQVSRGAMQIPTAGGAVCVIFNVPGVQKLRLSRFSLPAIFTGEIKRWNDPKLVRDNPGVTLPNLPIRTVVRADGSGTSFIFTNHLAAIDSKFRRVVTASQNPRWNTNPLKGKGNAGVAAAVSQTTGSISYVNTDFATGGKLETASLQDKKGKFVECDLPNANKAMATFKYPADSLVSVEGDPTEGYPIVGLTWMLVYKEYSAANRPAIQKFLNWVMTTGQGINGGLEYTRLPAPIVARAQAMIKSIK
jgi:phosphate transport system substrate-binding protein